MRFHEIDTVGKVWVQSVSSLPTWTSSDKRRILYLSTTGVYYMGGNTAWEAMTTGGNGAYISALTSDTHNGTITPSGDDAIDLGASGLRYANVYAVNFQGVTTTATYADLAEKYTMDQEYPVGTLMTIGKDLESEMTQANEIWDFVVGVVSDKPGVLLNADSVGQPVALVGKTPVRVVGTIDKGDFLTCDGDGCAVRTSGTNGMIGIALESNQDEDEKLVMCMLKL